MMRKSESLRKNIRYMAYCYAHGESNPNRMIIRDKPHQVLNFTEWNTKKIQEWSKASLGDVQIKDSDLVLLSRKEHADYDAWLIKKFPPPSEAA